MKESDKQIIADMVESEGFDYTFAHKSSFKEIKDPNFHDHLRHFRDARQQLIDYCGLTDV